MVCTLQLGNEDVIHIHSVFQQILITEAIQSAGVGLCKDKATYILYRLKAHLIHGDLDLILIYALTKGDPTGAFRRKVVLISHQIAVRRALASQIQAIVTFVQRIVRQNDHQLALQIGNIKLCRVIAIALCIGFGIFRALHVILLFAIAVEQRHRCHRQVIPEGQFQPNLTVFIGSFHQIQQFRRLQVHIHRNFHHFRRCAFIVTNGFHLQQQMGVVGQDLTGAIGKVIRHDLIFQPRIDGRQDLAVGSCVIALAGKFRSLLIVNFAGIRIHITEGQITGITHQRNINIVNSIHITISIGRNGNMAHIEQFRHIGIEAGIERCVHAVELRPEHMGILVTDDHIRLAVFFQFFILEVFVFLAIFVPVFALFRGIRLFFVFFFFHVGQCLLIQKLPVIAVIQDRRCVPIAEETQVRQAQIGAIHSFQHGKAFHVTTIGIIGVQESLVSSGQLHINRHFHRFTGRNLQDLVLQIRLGNQTNQRIQISLHVIHANRFILVDIVAECIAILFAVVLQTLQIQQICIIRIGQAVFVQVMGVEQMIRTLIAHTTQASGGTGHEVATGMIFRSGEIFRLHRGAQAIIQRMIAKVVDLISEIIFAGLGIIVAQFCLRGIHTNYRQISLRCDCQQRIAQATTLLTRTVILAAFLMPQRCGGAHQQMLHQFTHGQIHIGVFLPQALHHQRH